MVNITDEHTLEQRAKSAFFKPASFFGCAPQGKRKKTNKREEVVSEELEDEDDKKEESTSSTSYASTQQFRKKSDVEEVIRLVTP